MNMTMFGYATLISIDFYDAISPFSQFYLQLGRNIKQSRLCWTTVPNTVKFINLYSIRHQTGTRQTSTYPIMSSFLKNLIIICYEERMTVPLRKTMQERTVLNIAILTGL